MLSRRSLLRAAAVLAALTLPAGVSAQDRSITVASTTSTEQSGLFGHLLPTFTAKTGIPVKVEITDTERRLHDTNNRWGAASGTPTSLPAADPPAAPAADATADAAVDTVEVG